MPSPRPPNHSVRRPPSQPIKCFKCGRPDHFSNDCRILTQPRGNDYQNQNLQRPTSSQVANNHQFQQSPRPNFSPQNNSNQYPRPSVIQRNPNFHNQQQSYRTHMMNSDDSHYYPLNYHYDEYYTNNTYDQYYSDQNQFNDYQSYNPMEEYQSPDNFFPCSENYSQDNFEYQAPSTSQTANFSPVSNQNHPPIQTKTKETIAQIATQFQSLDLNNSPTSQEQIFL
nr:unnamed protein product [Callosobruchus analis]